MESPEPRVSKWKKKKKKKGMANFSCLPIAIFFLFSLAFVFEISQAGIAASNATYIQRISDGKGSLKPEQCKEKCGTRCKETSHQKPCNYFCNYCCKKCFCVPSGTSGNKEECPCYNQIHTKEGRPKCP